MATTTSTRAHEIIDDEALAEEELLAELENEEIPSHIREARLQALKKEVQDLKLMKDKQHGIYTEIPEEKAFLDLTTSEEKCIVHFYHADFRRCAIVDTHLEKLAKKYFETKFAKINVDKAKFLVEKLKIRILPAIFCFKGGIVVDKDEVNVEMRKHRVSMAFIILIFLFIFYRVVGFEEIGNTDSFQTVVLEKRLGKSVYCWLMVCHKEGNVRDCIGIKVYNYFLFISVMLVTELTLFKFHQSSAAEIHLLKPDFMYLQSVIDIPEEELEKKTIFGHSKLNKDSDDSDEDD
ncbi:hypothetical protein KUTeg_023071 [Tegillarca granosa]|uniref:Thioredoxin domain-containing protein 9 n=1 Tax=Tegillarca granosa TaxID=220873 RepID=A0ABQ9E3N0_TEGGR|nr:hypothetical protein KUTeg_023071 [Tegillarca granosa]